MNKKRIAAVISMMIAVCFVIPALACPSVTSDSTAGFCQAFEQASECQCATLSDQCSDMEMIYKNMIGNFGPDPEQAIDAACTMGDTFGWAKKQDCVDQWHCYLHGGTDSKGAKCYGNSGSGSNCQVLMSVNTQSKLCKK